MKPVTLNNWSNGATNLYEAERLPDGFARHAVNVDPLPGGTLAARCGYEQVYAGTDVRGMLALGSKLLIADAADLVEFDTLTNSYRVLRTIAGAGPFVGAVLNQILYFCTQNECLEYDGQEVRPWGVPDVFRQPELSVATGTLRPGHYQVAMTFMDRRGCEGGTSKPKIILCAAGEGIEVQVPEVPVGCTARLYVSSLNGSTLYEQRAAASGETVLISSVRDDTAECTTILQRSPRPASRMAKHNGVLLMGVGNCVEFTLPMRPHLCDRVRNFYQYPVPVGEVMSNGTLAFVSADQCYVLSGVETDTPSQTIALDSPAYSGTAVELPDGRVAWMTRYGQAISTDIGLSLVNKTSFAPPVADRGAAGVLEHNGNELIVTTTRGRQLGNELAAADFYIGEVLNP